MKVGFIGLGIMGRPMAGNLIKAGYSLIVNDLNEQAVKALEEQGAQAGSPKEIGAACDVIFLGAVGDLITFIIVTVEFFELEVPLVVLAG